MRFPPSFLEEIKARVPLSQVVSARVKLRKAGREFVGLSPFNTEKTPSFYVNDQKAAYFDHSAQKNGDCFSFLMETEGLSFTEAVERLAHMAGLPLPTVDAETVKREARKLSLIEMMERVHRFYVNALWSDLGEQARQYLAARKIPETEAKEFGLGYAPGGNALKSKLVEAKIDLTTAIEAGLIIAGEDIPVSHDRFRDRLMFPLADTKGRIVGFSGRILGPGEPKYLNSPETPIFNKGALLYNAHNARQPAHDGEPLVVVEGYTGAIASIRAGLKATVATMGTALTEAQLLALWRMSDSPILCFDGDGAGRRAAGRAVDLALPLLLPGRSLRFAMLPPGMDPDDMVRERGPGAFRRVVDANSPMADMFWRAKTEGRSLGTPEARAALEAEIREKIGLIPDAAVREQYRDDMLDRLKAVPRRTRLVRSNGHSHHSTSAGAVRLVHGFARNGMTLKEACLIASVVSYPDQAAEAAEEIADDPGLSLEVRAVAGQIIDMIAMGTADLRAGIAASPVAGTVTQAMMTLAENGISTIEPFSRH